MVKISSTKLFHYFGHFGPNIMLIVSSFLLLRKKIVFAVFLAGYFLNLMFNALLKHLIQEPRPSSKYHQFNLDFTEELVNASDLGAHEYGMPSGHAQSVFYCATFIHLALHNNFISAAYLFAALSTVYERILYKNHSVAQVTVGSLIGIIFAYATYGYVFSVV